MRSAPRTPAEARTDEHRYDMKIPVLWRTHALFAMIAGVFVTFFIVAIPPGWGWDEQSHVARAYQVGSGMLSPFTREDGVTLGADVPSSLVALEMEGHRQANAMDRNAPWWERADFADAVTVGQLWGDSLADSPRVEYDVSNAAASSFVAYGAGAVGLRVAEFLGLSVGASLLLAELLNAASYIALVGSAIWVLRRFRVRWVFFAVGLLPSAISQAAYLTADTYTNGASILFAALIVRLIVDTARASPAILWAAAIAGIAVVVAKPSYAVLLAIALAVPWNRVADTGRRIWRRIPLGGAIVGAYLIVAAGVAAMVLLATASASRAIAAMYARGADPAAQMAGLREDPVSVVGILVRTAGYYGEGWLKSLVGMFGYNTVAVPQPFAVIAVIAVVLAAFASERLGVLRGVIFAAASLVTGVVTIVAIYLSFSAVGSAEADGVQGRYFLPLLVPLVLGTAAIVPGRFVMSARGSAVMFPTIAVSALGATAVVWMLFLT